MPSSVRIVKLLVPWEDQAPIQGAKCAADGAVTQTKLLINWWGGVVDWIMVFFQCHVFAINQALLFLMLWSYFFVLMTRSWLF